MPMMPLLSTSDVACELGVDVRTVHRMVAAKRLAPVTKAPGLRGAYLFNPADVERLKGEHEAAKPVAS